jgi:hypothetical protein
MPLKPSYLMLTGAGAIVAYAGVKGKGLGAAAREVISGKSPASAASADTITQAVYGDVESGTPTASTTTTGTSATGAVAAKNKAIARPLAVAYGWGSGAQWQALDWTWTKESGWNNQAFNAGSGATGIPQALPATKMPLLARLPSQGGIASATLQIIWGLSYIKGRYGSPVAAWAHEVADDWY